MPGKCGAVGAAPGYQNGDFIMTARKRHTPAEIAAKLATADALLANGMRQQEVARSLGISVMTFHRWRKAQPDRRRAASIVSSHPTQDEAVSESKQLERIADLELENARLRRLVTDLLLDKVKLEQAASPELSPAGDPTARSSH
jgi:putative transposase